MAYSSVDDVWRQAWRWDRIAKGTHNRTHCISACSWNLFVKDGVVWREEQNALYESSRPDVPDFNPRGCQKGACYSDLQASASRVLHPLKRVGPRGSGRWKRISRQQAFDEIADRMIDATLAEGTESIVGEELHDGRRVATRPVFETLREHLAGYAPEQAAAVTGDTPVTDGIGVEEALAQGALRIVKPGTFGPLHQTASDCQRDDTYAPQRWFVDGKIAWPTLTGRQQFYLDHPWYVEAGEVLPVHKDPPGARSGLPLRLNGGHTRWSVHAIWRDHELMLRLQRGVPVCFPSRKDAAARRIRDGDRVHVRNASGAFQVQAKLSSAVRPGQVIVYHAWEPYPFPGWRGQQEPVETPWKPIHLAGGYGPLHYRMYYASPGHASRGTPVEVERIAPPSEAKA